MGRRHVEPRADCPRRTLRPDLCRAILPHAARAVASQIVRTKSEGLAGAAAYIHRASQELVAAVPEQDHETARSNGAMFECLERLLVVWPDIAARQIEGEQVFSGEPALWKRAMTEWPM